MKKRHHDAQITSLSEIVGMVVADVKKFKETEQENVRMKKSLAKTAITQQPSLWVKRWPCRSVTPFSVCSIPSQARFSCTSETSDRSRSLSFFLALAWSLRADSTDLR